MATIEYDISEQTIRTTKITDPLVKGTIGDYDVSFTFDSAWDTFEEKWAVFDPDNGDPWKQPIDNGACEFPGEVMWANSVIIGVYGVKDGVEFPTIWASRLWFKDGANVPADVSDYPEPSPVLAKLVSTEPQTFTDEQKTQARENIDALGKIEGTPGNIPIIGSNGNIKDSGMSVKDIISSSDPIYNTTQALSAFYIKNSGKSRYADIHRLGGMSADVFNYWDASWINFDSDTDYVNGVKFINNGDGSYTIDIAEGGCTAEVNKNLRTSTLRPTAYAGHVWLMKVVPDGDADMWANGFVAWFQSTSAMNKSWQVRKIISSPAYRYITVHVEPGSPAGRYTCFPQFIDMTVLFGAGNEPFTNAIMTDEMWNAVYEMGIDPQNVYYKKSYNGLVKAVPTGISMLNSSGEVVQNVTIPQAVLSLEGYGQGNYLNKNQYNYIDFDTQKYIEMGYYDGSTWIEKSAEVDISEYIPKTPFFAFPTGGKMRIEQSQTPKLTAKVLADWKKAKNLVNAETIAPVEDGYTASQAYAVGSFLFVGDTLYKVTSAISSGATITPNTNCVATTVAEQLIALA